MMNRHTNLAARASFARRALHALAVALLFFAGSIIIRAALFTRQDHLFDLATGAMLAALCCWIGPRACSPTPEKPHRDARRIDIARLYVLGAGGFAIIALIFGGWSWLLAWPAGAMAIVAVAYARGDAHVFRKRADGGLPISTRAVFAPVLLAAWMWRLPYRLRAGSPLLAAEGVYIGGTPLRRDVKKLREIGIGAVLDLAAECGENRFLRGINYHSLPLLDFAPASHEELDVATSFIRTQRESGRIVYVHCALGRCRARQVIEAYLRSTDVEQIAAARSASGTTKPAVIAAASSDRWNHWVRSSGSSCRGAQRRA